MAKSAAVFNAWLGFTLSDSVIAANTADLFFLERRVILRNCYYNTLSLPMTLGGTFLTVNCFPDAADMSWVPERSAT
jgi:hypothetical protein